MEVDKEYVEKLVELAINHGGDLTELQMFLESIVYELEIDFIIPNLWDLQERLYAEED